MPRVDHYVPKNVSTAARKLNNDSASKKERSEAAKKLARRRWRMEDQGGQTQKRI